MDERQETVDVEFIKPDGSTFVMQWAKSALILLPDVWERIAEGTEKELDD